MSTYKTFSLFLEEYCDGCRDFEADIEQIDVRKFRKKSYLTDIRCKNADRCRRIHEQIERQLRVEK